MTDAYMTLVLLEIKEINKVHFKEKVLNHFITQEQNDGKNDIATHL